METARLAGTNGDFLVAGVGVHDLSASARQLDSEPPCVAVPAAEGFHQRVFEGDLVLDAMTVVRESFLALEEDIESLPKGTLDALTEGLPIESLELLRPKLLEDEVAGRARHLCRFRARAIKAVRLVYVLDPVNDAEPISLALPGSALPDGASKPSAVDTIQRLA